MTADRRLGKSGHLSRDDFRCLLAKWAPIIHPDRGQARRIEEVELAHACHGKGLVLIETFEVDEDCVRTTSPFADPWCKTHVCA